MCYRSKRGPVVALASTNLQIQEGSFTTVVGPSGCGKSTLLKLIAGLLRPTAGTVEVVGMTAHSGNPALGIMLQQPTLLPWRSVLNNVLLPFDVRKQRSPERVQQAYALINSVGLAGFEKHLPAELSGGMQQRVALCRALVSDPKVVLFDEPFGAVDSITREQLNDLVKEVCQARGCTAVLVTHDIDEAVYMGNEVVVMSARPGRVVKQISIDLPQPRNYQVRQLPRFGEYATEVRTQLGMFQ